MNTSMAYDAYRSHDLSISMKTSSGDVIEMDFSNRQSTSLRHSEKANGSSTSLTFSSMQSFHFSIESNGIDAQDQKEIDAFMKIAQPFIDSFLKELSQDAPKSPVTKLAHQIASLFDPNRDRSDDSKNHIKTNIVKMFDNALQNIEPMETLSMEELIAKIFEDSKKLLEKTLKEFENFNNSLYA